MKADSVMQLSNNRLIWVDQSKGLAIILVVLGHVLTNGISAGTITETKWEIIASYIYSFHMPLFFFISGYLQKNINTKNRKMLWKNFQLKELSLLIPYLFFSTLYWLVKYIFSGTAAVINRVSIFQLFEIVYIPIGEYWFLYSLLLMNVIFFLIQIFLYDTITPKAISRVLSVATVIFGAVFVLVFDISSDIGYIRMLHFVVYFFAGNLYYRFSEKLTLSIGTRYIICPLFLIAAIIIFMFDKIQDWNVALIDLTIACLMISFVYTLFSLINIRLLSFLGRLSLEIYLLHVYFVVFSRLLFQAMNLENADIIVVFSTLISIVGPILIYSNIFKKVKILDFLINPKIYIKKYIKY